MKRFQWVALWLLSVTLALWIGSCSAPPRPIVILNFGGAGMVRNAMETLESLYQSEHPNVVINSIFAGSRVIQTAVEQGEPFDGVLFADTPPLDQLQAQGLIVPESRKEFLSTDIVVIAPVNSSLQLSSFQDLTDDRIKSIAIGSPNLAIGRYTQSLLTKLGINPAIAAKAMQVKVDVREVLRAVEHGEAAVGITFLSEAKASVGVKVLAVARHEDYDLIRSGVAVVKASAHPQDMQAYLDFLQSDRAGAIFEKFGLHSLRL